MSKTKWWQGCTDAGTSFLSGPGPCRMVIYTPTECQPGAYGAWNGYDGYCGYLNGKVCTTSTGAWCTQLSIKYQ